MLELQTQCVNELSFCHFVILCVQYQVNNLEQKKQVSLLCNVEGYWSSFCSFASAQSSILSQHQIEKGIYSPPSQIEVFEAPQQQQQIVTPSVPSMPSPPEDAIFSPMDEHKETAFNGQQNGNEPPPAFGGGFDVMGGGGMGMNGMGTNGMGGGGMPPPNESGDAFEYYEEESAVDQGYAQNGNQNKQDFNPFDD